MKNAFFFALLVASGYHIAWHLLRELEWNSGENFNMAGFLIYATSFPWGSFATDSMMTMRRYMSNSALDIVVIVVVTIGFAFNVAIVTGLVKSLAIFYRKYLRRRNT